MRSALDVRGLFEEVKAEIKEINEYLAAERESRLNEVLAFLTLVLTPMSLIIELYGRETLPPGDFELRLLADPGSWGRLFTHWPFLFVLGAGIIGVALFIRFVGRAQALVARVRGRR